MSLLESFKREQKIIYAEPALQANFELQRAKREIERQTARLEWLKNEDAEAAGCFINKDLEADFFKQIDKEIDYVKARIEIYQAKAAQAVVEFNKELEIYNKLYFDDLGPIDFSSQ